MLVLGGKSRKHASAGNRKTKGIRSSHQRLKQKQIVEGTGGTSPEVTPPAQTKQKDVRQALPAVLNVGTNVSIDKAVTRHIATSEDDETAIVGWDQPEEFEMDMYEADSISRPSTGGQYPPGIVYLQRTKHGVLDKVLGSQRRRLKTKKYMSVPEGWGGRSDVTGDRYFMTVQRKFK